MMSEEQVASTAASNQASEAISTASSVEEQLSDSDIEILDKKDVYLRLVSAEGEEFRVKRQHALISGTIRAILSGPGPDVEETDVIYLREMPSRVVQKICAFFEYRARYPTALGDHPTNFKIEADIALEMIIASIYLDC